MAFLLTYWLFCRFHVGYW